MAICILSWKCVFELFSLQWNHSVWYFQVLLTCPNTFCGHCMCSSALICLWVTWFSYADRHMRDSSASINKTTGQRSHNVWIPSESSDVSGSQEYWKRGMLSFCLLKSHRHLQSFQNRCFFTLFMTCRRTATHKNWLCGKIFNSASHFIIGLLKGELFVCQCLMKNTKQKCFFKIKYLNSKCINV